MSQRRLLLGPAARVVSKWFHGQRRVGEPHPCKEVLMSTTVETATEIQPFHVEIPEEQIDDLRRRIAATRWPSKELVADRSQGVQLATLQELARYWDDRLRLAQGARRS